MPQKSFSKASRGSWALEAPGGATTSTGRPTTRSHETVHGAQERGEAAGYGVQGPPRRRQALFWGNKAKLRR